MVKGEEFKSHFEILAKDESEIKFFVKYALKNLIVNPKKMKRGMEELLSFSNENNIEIGIAYSKLYIGRYYLWRLELEKALKFFLEARDIFYKINCKQGIIDTLNGLLLTYYKKGLLDLAIEYGIEGIALSNEIEKYSNIQLSINISIVFKSMGLLEEAVSTLESILKRKSNMDLYKRMSIYNLLAEIYINQNKDREAKEYIEKSLKIIREGNVTVCSCESYTIKALILWKQKDFVEALKWFEVSVQLSKKYENIESTLNTLMYISDFLVDVNKYSEAEDRLLEALLLIEKIESAFYEKEIYDRLNKLAERMKNIQKAYYYLKLKDNCEKRLFNENSGKWVSRINTKNVEREATSYKSLYKQIEIISSLGMQLTLGFSIKDMIRVLFDGVKNIIAVDVLKVALYDEVSNNLNYEVYVDNMEKCHNSTIELNNEESFEVYTFKNNKDILMNNILKEGRKYIKNIDSLNLNVCGNQRVLSSIFIPLTIEEKIIGVMGIQSYEEDVYTTKDLNALKLIAKYLSIAIENSTLFNKVKFLATHDGLTNQLNRTEILRVGEDGFSSLVSKNTLLSIIMIDIDYFKSVNDKYGHVVGDRVLVTICKLIENETTNKTLGRYGGEEFLLVYEGKTKAEVIKSAENIRREVENHIFYDDKGSAFNVTLSLGIYEFKGSEKGFYEGIIFADRALYSAKDFGRNSFNISNG